MSEADDLAQRRNQAETLAHAAEASIERMYEARDKTTAAAHYSDAKEALHDAIGLAQSARASELAERLTARLMHLKEVFRSQFS